MLYTYLLAERAGNKTKKIMDISSAFTNGHENVIFKTLSLIPAKRKSNCAAEKFIQTVIFFFFDFFFFSIRLIVTLDHKFKTNIFWSILSLSARNF